MPGKPTIQMWQLERYALAELPPEEMKMVAEAIEQDKGLKQKLVEINQADQAFLKQHPFDNFYHRLEQKMLEQETVTDKIKRSVSLFQKRWQTGLMIGSSGLAMGIALLLVFDVNNIRSGLLEGDAEIDNLVSLSDKEISFSQIKDGVETKKVAEESFQGSSFTSGSLNSNLAPGYKGQNTSGRYSKTLRRDKRNQRLVLAQNRRLTSAKKKVESGDVTISRDGKTILFSPRIYFPRNSAVQDRMLEYHVNLNFETDSFQRSRARLMALVDKYGYMQESHALLERHEKVNSRVIVESKNLYRFLQNADGLGRLLSEKIQTADHTGEHVRQRLDINRQSLRQRRRANALRGTPNSETWVEREKLVAEAEDRRDAARMAQWNIEDRIKWAKVNINLRGPRQTPVIELPNYVEALVFLLNGLLWLLKGLLYILPLIGLGLLGWVYRQQILGLFRKN